MDEFKFEKVFSSIDSNGDTLFQSSSDCKVEYLKIGQCLLPLIDSNQDSAIKFVEKEVVSLFDQFEEKRMKILLLSLG